MKVFLIRHAECKANTVDIILGAGESPLSKKGWAQAKALARFFSSKKIDAIYSSPLSRAVNTAKTIAGTIAGRRKKITVDKRLIERNLGLLQGMRMKRALKTYPRAFKKNDFCVNLIFYPPGGETWLQARRRMKSFFSSLLKTRWKNVAIVSHSDAIRSLLGYWLEKPLEDYFLIPQANACINEVELSGRRVKIIKVNYVKHLKYTRGEKFNG